MAHENKLVVDWGKRSEGAADRIIGRGLGVVARRETFPGKSVIKAWVGRALVTQTPRGRRREEGSTEDVL